MGQIAEETIVGVWCQECGQYIGDEVGYPRSCLDCNPPKNKILKRLIRKSSLKRTRRGVNNDRSIFKSQA